MEIKLINKISYLSSQIIVFSIDFSKEKQLVYAEIKVDKKLRKKILCFEETGRITKCMKDLHLNELLF